MAADGMREPELGAVALEVGLRGLLIMVQDVVQPRSKLCEAAQLL